MGIERLNEFWPEWRIESELGEGAFGKVYKAVDEEAGFPVYSAIKVLSIPATKAELDALRSEGMTVSETRTYFKEIVDGFVNEIKLMHTLKGAPNIVSVEAFKIAEKVDSIGWDIFIRMELLTSFKECINGRALSESEVVKLGVDIATALEICQKENIIHRDIKPANIFADKYGSFKLGDFGIAKELEKTTGAVSSKGTFSYMAPEVAHGMRYDNTVDIYSLGLVMYSLLNNNRPPFVDPHKAEVGYNDRRNANDRRLSGEPLPPPCNASPVLADVILMACSYDPARRFRSATAFKNALKAYMNMPKQTTVPASPAPKQNIDSTTAVRRPEPKPQMDATIAVAHKAEVKQQAAFKELHPVQPRPEVRMEDVEEPKKSKKGIIIAAAVLLVLAIIAVAVIPGMSDGKKTGKDTVTTDTIAEETNNSSEYPEISASANVGDIVTFGHYEQDNDTSNGKEEIEWIVLAKEDGKALVTSKYALDCQPYNEEYTSVTWEESDIRAWLNDEFYNTAFSESERSEIETTYVVNDDNAEYGTDGGNDTSDKIFLLSIAEAEEYFSSDEARECEPTKYAVAEGAYENSDNGNCWLWLRSPGYYTYNAAVINTYGVVNDYGINVNYSSLAVRPALWINL